MKSRFEPIPPYRPLPKDLPVAGLFFGWRGERPMRNLWFDEFAGSKFGRPQGGPAGRPKGRPEGRGTRMCPAQIAPAFWPENCSCVFGIRHIPVPCRRRRLQALRGPAYPPGLLPTSFRTCPSQTLSELPGTGGFSTPTAATPVTPIANINSAFEFYLNPIA